MRIPTADLERLVEHAGYGAVGGERTATLRAIRALRAHRTEADLESAGSRFLANVIATCAPVIEPVAVARLARVSLYGVDIPYANAVPQLNNGIERIFMFEGLQHQICYVIDLLKVLERLQAFRSDAVCKLNGEVYPEPLAFSLAAFSILSEAMEAQRFPPLLRDMLGPVAKRDALHAYQLAMVFVLLHELGHLALDHLDARGVRSERPPLSLVEPEALDLHKAQELEADAFALEQIRPAFRAELAPSLTFFFAPMAFFEAFGSLGTRHPLAVNRLAAGLARIDLPESVRTLLASWIDDRVTALRRMSDERAAGASLRARIEQRVPVKVAYAALQAIKARISREHGPLEMPIDADRATAAETFP